MTKKWCGLISSGQPVCRYRNCWSCTIQKSASYWVSFALPSMLWGQESAIAGKFRQRGLTCERLLWRLSSAWLTVIYRDVSVLPPLVFAIQTASRILACALKLNHGGTDLWCRSWSQAWDRQGSWCWPASLLINLSTVLQEHFSLSFQMSGCSDVRFLYASLESRLHACLAVQRIWAPGLGWPSLCSNSYLAFWFLKIWLCTRG